MKTKRKRLDLNHFRARLADAKAAFASGQVAMLDIYRELMRDLEGPIAALQHRRQLPRGLTNLCRVVLTDASVLGRQIAQASGKGRDPEYANAVIAGFKDALMAFPGDERICHNFGVFLMYLGQYNAAVECFRSAVMAAPRHPASWAAGGFAWARGGHPEQADRWWNEAIRLADLKGEPEWTVAPIRLMRGDWPRGWTDYEGRFAEPFGMFLPIANTPNWDGSRVNRLLVYGNMGAGDVFNMLCYVPLVRERCDALTVRVPPSMVRLVVALLESYGVTVQADADPIPEHDAQVAWMSFPAIFETTTETVPGQFAWMLKFSKRPDDRPLDANVGICWHGDPKHSNDHNRSMPRASADRIVDAVMANKFRVQSLQYGELFGHGLAPTGDWFDTARLIASCCLVITVDTSITHLAGLLGVPTWLLVPEPAEYRWLDPNYCPAFRDASVWYPNTHAVIRQPKAGDWEGVVNEVIHRLEAM